MIVKLKETKPTIEAFRVNDDNLPAIITRLHQVVTINPLSFDHPWLEWHDGAAAWAADQGDYILFEDRKVAAVLSADDLHRQYEEVREPGSVIPGFVPNRFNQQIYTAKPGVFTNVEAPRRYIPPAPPSPPSGRPSISA